MDSNTNYIGITILVLNWNDFESSIACLKSCVTSVNSSSLLENRKATIILIDNYSTDKSNVKLEKWISLKNTTSCVQLVFLQSKKNGGYAYGNNIGLKASKKYDSKYIIILNNDALLNRNALDLMIASLEYDKEIGVIGPAIRDQQSKKIQSAGKVLDLKFSHHTAFYEINTGLINVGYISGACLMLRESILKSIGYLDESFFMYTEDVEFCYRVHVAGYKVTCQTNAIIEHSSEGSIDRYSRDSFRIYYQIRNNILFAKKHFHRTSLIVYSFSVFLRSIKKTFTFLVNRNFRAIKSIWVGYFDGLLSKTGRRNES